MLPAKKPSTSLIKGDSPKPSTVADWQQSMRTALMEGVTPDDMRAIAKGLVERAKKGDKQATEVLFKYVLGDPRVNVQNAIITSAPTGARPGTTDKLDVMRLRVERGLPAHANGDAGFVDGADLD